MITEIEWQYIDTVHLVCKNPKNKLAPSCYYLIDTEQRHLDPWHDCNLTSPAPPVAWRKVHARWEAGIRQHRLFGHWLPNSSSASSTYIHSFILLGYTPWRWADMGISGDAACNTGSWCPSALSITMPISAWSSRAWIRCA